MKKAIKLIALSLVLVRAVMALASCAAPNADPSKAKNALEKNDYTIIDLPTSTPVIGLSSILGEDVDTAFSATKYDKENSSLETITVIYFESSEDANDAWEKAQKYAGEKKDKDVEESNWVVEKSGKMIWFGTKNAVKAAA